MKTFEAGNDAAPLNCCPIEEKNDKNARNDSTVVFLLCSVLDCRMYLLLAASVYGLRLLVHLLFQSTTPK